MQLSYHYCYQRRERRLRFIRRMAGVLSGVNAGRTCKVVAAKIAAVVHALCDRDGIAVPEWVYRCRLDPEIILWNVPFDSAFATRVRASAPRVCAAHGVWFSADLLDA